MCKQVWESRTGLTNGTFFLIVNIAYQTLSTRAHKQSAFCSSFFAPATAIPRRMAVSLPELTSRLQSQGVGYRENLIGTGPDDWRVGFRVRPCP